MIELQEDLLIASGRDCRCYRHPHAPEECLKILTGHPGAKRRNFREICAYRALHSRHIDPSHLADHLGKVHTSLGKADRYQLIRDSNGQISKSLRHYLKTGQPERSQLISATHLLADYLVQNAIITSDLNPENILIQLSENTPPKAILIDGISDKSYLPVLNIFPSLRRKRALKRVRHSLGKLDPAFHYPANS